MTLKNIISTCSNLLQGMRTSGALEMLHPVIESKAEVTRTVLALAALSNEVCNPTLALAFNRSSVNNMPSLPLRNDHK